MLGLIFYRFIIDLHVVIPLIMNHPNPKLFGRFTEECVKAKQFLERILEKENLNEIKRDPDFMEDGLEFVAGFNRSLKYMFGGKLVKEITPVISNNFEGTNSNIEPQLPSQYNSIDETNPENPTFLSLLNNKIIRNTSTVTNKDVKNIQNNCFDNNNDGELNSKTLSTNHIDIDSKGHIPYQPIVSLNTTLDCFIVHVKSPGEFFVSLNGPFGIPDSFLEELNKFYNDNSSLIMKKDVRPDEAYCCLFKGMWSRVFVTGIVDEHMSCCYFIDYGFTENIDISRLFPLRADFKNTPPIAFRCHLANVLPINADIGWTTESIKYMKSRCSTSSGTIFALEENENGSLGVLLNIDNIPIHCDIFHYKHATLRSPFIELEPQITIVPDSTQINEDDSFHEDIPLETEVEGVVSHLIDPSHFYVAITSKDYEKLSEDIMQFCNDVNKKHNENSNKMYYGVLHENKWERCLVVKELHDKMEVFLIDNGASLQVPSASLKPLPRTWCDQPPMAYKCHLFGITPKDGVWSKKAIKQTKITILRKKCTIFIHERNKSEYGVTLKLDGISVNDKIVLKNFADRIEKPTPAIDDMIPQIMNLPMGAEEEDVDLSHAVQGYSANDEAEVCPHYKGPPHKTCFKGSRCKKIHQIMHPHGWTIKRIPVLVESDQTYPIPDSMIQIVVTTFINFKSFYGHVILCNQENENALHYTDSLSNMQKILNSSSSIKSLIKYDKCEILPAISELVLAFFDADQQWYRAKVVSVDDETCEVFFIDYGNIQNVELSKMAVMDKLYSELPPQAMFFVIDNIDEPCESVTETEASQALVRIISDKILFGHVMSVEPPRIYINLFDAEYNVGEYLHSLNVVSMRPSQIETLLPGKSITIIPG